MVQRGVLCIPSVLRHTIDKLMSIPSVPDQFVPWIVGLEEQSLALLENLTSGVDVDVQRRRSAVIDWGEHLSAVLVLEATVLLRSPSNGSERQQPCRTPAQSMKEWLSNTSAETGNAIALHALGLIRALCDGEEVAPPPPNPLDTAAPQRRSSSWLWRTLCFSAPSHIRDQQPERLVRVVVCHMFIWNGAC